MIIITQRLQSLFITGLTGAEDNIDVASFLASPRHSYWFFNSEDAID